MQYLSTSRFQRSIPSRGRCLARPRSFAVLTRAFAAPSPHQDRAARVLRYTDGEERRILYPPPDVDIFFSHIEQDACELQWDYGFEGECGSRADFTSGWDDTYEDDGLTVAAVAPNVFTITAAPVAPAQRDAAANTADTAWSTPADLLRASEAHHRHITGRYQVLHSCPWILPRPLFLLATQPQDPQEGAEGSPSSVYTLRTRVEGPKEGLAQALGAKLMSKIEFAEIKDGVVAFDTLQDAEHFASHVEYEGDVEVSVIEMNSHALFRSVVDALGIVVHVPPTGGDQPPLLPHQLASALRGSRSWDQGS